MTTEPISGAILIGGKSRRMGRDKALLRVHGRPLVSCVHEAIGRVTDDLLLVGATPGRSVGCTGRPVTDTGPGKGPLVGIRTALSAARYDQCLVVGCDMPFLNGELLRYMQRLATGWDAVVPRSQDGLEPLHAIYSRSCLARIVDMLENENLCPLDLFPVVRTRYVERNEVAAFQDGELSFLNVNTPADLALARRLAGRPTGEERTGTIDWIPHQKHSRGAETTVR